MSDVKEYIKGDKHVHQAGSMMIKFAQYNVPGQQGDWKRQEAQEAEELEREFADFEEVVDESKPEPPGQPQVKPDLPPADVFVNMVKAIVKEAATQNGKTIPAKPRGQVGEYVFFVDGERIVKMMDDLRKNYEKKIVDFLQPYQKCDGVTVVAPFIGKLLDIEELRSKDLQKSDMAFAFVPYYNNGASAVKRMSDKLGSEAAKLLLGTFEGLLKKYPKT